VEKIYQACEVCGQLCIETARVEGGGYATDVPRPECADTTAAIRKVREAKMTASAAVALEGMV
jgi:hypothetical protein